MYGMKEEDWEISFLFFFVFEKGKFHFLYS
jgi:hypothetical protein